MGFRSALFASRYDSATRRMEETELGRRRAALLAGLTGDVLDVGAGTGANLPHFPPSCTVTAVEPDPHMRRRLEEKVASGAAGAAVSVSDGSAEALPAADGSIDAVVFTLVLCTVPDQPAALAETRRVLKPGGRLLFLEHVRGTGRHAKAQDLLRPFWSFAAQGCQINRDTSAAIAAAGFALDLQEQFSLAPAWLPVNPFVAGTGTKSG
jgi:ubiquinone/menaquinone biosynthesis C-methylase UbiE